jgi:hypothetical protein
MEKKTYSTEEAAILLGLTYDEINELRGKCGLHHSEPLTENNIKAIESYRKTFYKKGRKKR